MQKKEEVHIWRCIRLHLIDDADVVNLTSLLTKHVLFLGLPPPVIKHLFLTLCYTNFFIDYTIVSKRNISEHTRLSGNIDPI